MRRARWGCCAINVLAAAAAAAERDPIDDLQHITRAEVAIEQIDIGAWTDSPPVVPTQLSWHSVALPFIGQVPDPARGGGTANARLWLRFTVEVPAHQYVNARALAFAAYNKTSSAAAFYIDGALYSATNQRIDRSWNQPVLLTLPSVLNSMPLRQQIAVAFDCAPVRLSCGAPSLRVGSLEQIRGYFERELFLRLDVPRIGSLAILILGAFALVFWVRRRQEIVYAIFCVAALLWTLRNLHYWLPEYPQPVDWFWWATFVSLPWLSVTVYLFAFRLFGTRWRRFEWVLYGAAAVPTVLLMPTWEVGTSRYLLGVIAFALQGLLGLIVTLVLSWAAVRNRRREQLALALALWVMVGFGIYDLLLLDWRVDMESFFLLPFAALPLFGAFVYAMARRYRGAISEAETLNASLESRLTERQLELASSYERLRAYEIHNAQIEERQRLMRDMHDGVGSTLVSTLALVERGNMPPDLLASSLREAVDELKLTIDSLEPIDRDLVTLLATLRYRLAPRLERAGLQLSWQVEDLPPLEWLDERQALQVLRIVQECISNVLKHAQANRIDIRATANNGYIDVSVADNGRGFDVVAQQREGRGRGLRNLQTRAKQLDAQIDYECGATGTTVRLRLRVHRTPAPGSNSDAHAPSTPASLTPSK